MKVRVWIGAIVVLCALAQGTAFAGSLPAASVPAGRIKILTGSVVIVRGGSSLAAQIGQVVFEADTLKTGANGRVGVTLLDDTRLSIGPDSDVRLDRFAYAPADGRFALVVNFVHGVAAYVSGRIAKLAPDAIRLETPSAIVGVRGTTVLVKVP